MPGVARIGDSNTGEPCFPPTTALVGSVDVFANNVGIVRQGDSYGIHNCGNVVHPVVAGAGSSSVFVNNIPAVRQGDAMSCNPINFAHVGSTDVFFGG